MGGDALGGVGGRKRKGEMILLYSNLKKFSRIKQKNPQAVVSIPLVGDVSLWSIWYTRKPNPDVWGSHAETVLAASLMAVTKHPSRSTLRLDLFWIVV